MSEGGANKGGSDEEGLHGSDVDCRSEVRLRRLELGALGLIEYEMRGEVREEDVNRGLSRVYEVGRVVEQEKKEERRSKKRLGFLSCDTEGANDDEGGGSCTGSWPGSWGNRDSRQLEAGNCLNWH